MKDIDKRGSDKDDTWCDGTENEEEEVPIRRSFSVEDLLDEVEKISNVASGGSKVKVVVRLWKDGFTLNDEEFRSYSVQENQDFLEAIKRGKKTFHPFSGPGYRLGSVAPRVVVRSPSVHEEGEFLPIPMITLDHGLPVTSLQIWLADGRRLVQRFNLSHRISDVHDYVQRCQRNGSPFILTTSLPFRELREEELSLEQADLTNAVIVQRPLNTEAPFGHT
ncbi:UBX domain-containing protein 2A isoform X2 [Coregonus clupeaformis]|uniref:UBX domain-containing protein 2A isoform X2 n=1 Tax=Coregonus clupeaformis TaxID=59861 RepID=UPI001BE043E9|nr:UBX domain-containing protein 2A isoform X2 [Coregonus clupeaformis]